MPTQFQVNGAYKEILVTQMEKADTINIYQKYTVYFTVPHL